MNIATEILNQLGGTKFIIMTGSKNLQYSKDDPYYLSMQLARNKSGAKYLTIRLNTLDLYDMTFMKIKDNKLVNVAQHTGIYHDMLQSIFTKVTGLDTHL